ncbi:hypothetical protein CCACVL1_30519, partial [Corchorus capsularis]
VFTEILESKEPVNWDQVKSKLEHCGTQCSDHKFGYTAEVTIDDGKSSTTKVIAKLRPAC